MSIVLKSNQLNALIYKYFLEAGLTHSAFVFLTQSNLSASLQQLKYDIKAGHLLTLLEKGLIFSQIESHVTINEYQQCLEPFQLIKAHSCKITEKIKEDKESILKELTDQIDNSMRRTNAIYHTEIKNQQFDQIVYEAKGSKYFDKFIKVRLPMTCDNEQDDQTKYKKYAVEGQNSQSIAIYDESDNIITILKLNDQTQDMSMTDMYPCISNNKFAKLAAFVVTEDYIIKVFMKNYITIIKKNNKLQPFVQFKSSLPQNQQITQISINNHFPHLVCMSSAGSFQTINLKNMKQICHGQGVFIWKLYDQFLVWKDSELSYRSILKLEESLLVFNHNEMQIDSLKMSSNGYYFLAENLAAKHVQVYTFDCKEPLYIFRFEKERELKQTLWVNSKLVEYLVFLTDQKIKIWEMELNAYSKIIYIQQYDVSIYEMLPLRKAAEQMFLLCLGNKHISVYDISNTKIQRMDIEGTVMQIKSIGAECIAFILDYCLYIINGQQIEPLFK